MPRPVWTGAIAFGLVSVPVKLYTATRDQSVRFNQLEEGTGARIRYRRVSEQSGEEVPRERIARGYDLGDGRYVTVTDDEIEAAAPEATKTIDIEDFVELAQVDPVYYDTTYYLGPADQTAHRAYALLYEAMRRSGRAAIGRLVLRTRQRLVALRPMNGVLALETMHFHDEVSDSSFIDVPDPGDVSDRELAAANQLIDSLATDFKPESYADTYRERLLETIERKARGEEIVAPEEPEEPAEVVDLVAALRESVERSRGRADSEDGSRAGERAPPAASAVEEATDTSSERPAGDTAGDGFEEMTRPELYRRAQEAEIPGRSDMSKEDLIVALRARAERRSA